MIIVCPKCSRKHKVSPDAVKPYIQSGKKLFATCKACKYRFPVLIDSLRDLEQSAEQPILEPKIRARKICVTLSKGGVGKTTTSVNLSCGLALTGYRVLLVDTDTQGQSAYMLGKKPGAGLTELLTGELTPNECILEARKNLWLLGGGKSLAGVKRIIDRKSYGAEWALSEALSNLDTQYDFIIMDTAPGWDQLIVNVLFYATEVLVPVALEVMPLHGLSEFLKSLGSIQKYRKEIELKYIVPTFLDTRIKGPQTLYSQLKKLYPDKLCAPIHYNESLAEAPSFGKSIFEFAPGSRASADYRELVRKVSMNDKAFS
ncbi:AAA family ATPase [Desulfotignum phosphitoxidans]|uniref:Cobyrinic acid a,c-diamide synthetase CbiA n=1 Tax=Desulfotignum phosphitoxidans DSM 13687 TaxID=1286635 RepID=S0G5J1_9BACT|nr:AAA family ATPase [Desulfotignum phosphitoxidans]EMS79491.1 cobyrinic acid a,c-diamide synthetase CbiA [Desulfotignum phosphitoxidans DSM 13687]